MAPIVAILGLIVGIIVLIFAVVLITFFRLWLQALLSGAKVSLASLVGMYLRKVNPNVIVNSRIMAVKAGLELSTNDLETHYLAGGSIIREERGNTLILGVVLALIMANKANIPLTFERATAIDLALKDNPDRDLVTAVKTYVSPRVIDCPDPAKGATTVSAVAMDGIQLRAKARVTVRTRLETLVGGATEETIIARVGEGIVTTIGSAESHKRVLENPDSISKRVLERGLDAGTAFEILSIDIADVDVGENIGAKLQIDQAEANKQIAQAQAERRYAEARAREQEMRALVVEREAEVPLAMAESFRSGHLGIMDYYRMRNIVADTGMRQSISDMDKPDG